MSAGNVGGVIWFVRHHPKSGTFAKASVTLVDDPTPVEAVPSARTFVPEDNVPASAAAY